MNRNSGRRPNPAKLLPTTALGTILAMNGVFPSAAIADSGLPCVMTGGACVISTNGINGTDGLDGPGDNPGQDGTLGAPADDIMTDIESAQNLVSDGATSPVNVTAIGGSGGSGGNAGNPGGLDRNRGGNGQPGSDGGTVNVTLGPNTSGVSQIGPNGQLVSAVNVVSKGGDGGGGGVPTEQEGDSGQGVSATGGNGQDVIVTIGGTWTSDPGTGLYAASLGGRGGEGKDTNLNLAKDGTPGGNGGNSGDVSATITGTGNLTGLSYGARVYSAGGNGGHGGAGLNEDGASGGEGGNGGNAGNATATLSTGATVLTTDAQAAASGRLLRRCRRSRRHWFRCGRGRGRSQCGQCLGGGQRQRIHVGQRRQLRRAGAVARRGRRRRRPIGCLVQSDEWQRQPGRNRRNGENHRFGRNGPDG